MKSTYIILLAAILLIPEISIFSQETSMRSLERQFTQTESAISQLKKERVDLEEKLQKKTEDIQDLKDKSRLNYFQRQNLEGLLKDSQDLSNQITALDSRLRQTHQRWVETGRELIKIYDSQIRKSLTNLETRELSPEFRKTVLQNIEKLRREKENIKRKLTEQDRTEIRLSEIQIEPDDTPKQIQQKADLLKDQEDKFRVLAKQLNSRKQELQKELNLRSRIDDLVMDLALFDQQEEILGNLSASGANLQTEDVQTAVDFTERSTFSDNDLFLVGQKDFDFSTLSSEQLEEIIENLAKQEQQAKTKADSLDKRAETFYRAAKESKKQ